ncbi:MAG: hypothetical protein JWM59_3702 [Verrucomicrobiales bacterium]|nr:hypothetical protein [Verrucomicrobiales bacterium]
MAVHNSLFDRAGMYDLPFEEYNTECAFFFHPVSDFVKLNFNLGYFRVSQHPMKISHSLLLAASTAAAGAAGAWFLKPTGPAGGTGHGPAGVFMPPAAAAQGSQLAVTVETKAAAAAVLASPMDFLKSQKGQPSLVARSRILAAVGAMSLEEIRAATVKLRAMGEGGGTPAQWELTSCVYERWAELDPESLLTEAVHRGMQDQTGYLGVTSAFRELVKKDADGAWKRAQDLGPLSYYAKREILSGIGSGNPQQALKLAMADGPTRRDSYLCGGFMQSWLARDRGGAVAALEALPQGEFRAGLVGQIAGAFAAQDADGALAWAAGLKNSAESTGVIRSVLSQLAGEDPQRVLAMADDPKYAQHRLEALSSAVSSWGRRDFDAAVSFTLSAKSPAEQAAMFRPLNENASPSQRAKLLAMADKMSPAMAKTIYSSALNDYYFGSQSDPKSILEKVTSPAMREELTKNAIGNYGTSVEEGVELFRKLQPVSQPGEQASELAKRLAWSDPAAALKWAESLSSADLRKSALTSAPQT